MQDPVEKRRRCRASWRDVRRAREHVGFTYTAGMDEERVKKRLKAAETGVLALADGSDAYAVPLTFF